jgi:hypothetical protein
MMVPVLTLVAAFLAPTEAPPVVTHDPVDLLADTLMELSADTLLELRHRADVDPAVGYQHSRGDLYWKIGITLPDVDLARESLIADGIEVASRGSFAT